MLSDKPEWWQVTSWLMFGAPINRGGNLDRQSRHSLLNFCIPLYRERKERFFFVYICIRASDMSTYRRNINQNLKKNDISIASSVNARVITAAFEPELPQVISTKLNQ